MLFPSVPTNPIDGVDLLSPDQRRQGSRRGRSVRSVPRASSSSPARTSTPRRSRGFPTGCAGLVNFGANLVMAHGDSARGRDALAALDFFVHADLFMNPTAELADIVLPVTSAFETEGLRVGFEISAGGAVTGAAAPTTRAAARRGPLGSPDHLRARDPPRTRRALLGRRPRRRLPPPARPQRGHPRAAPRRTRPGCACRCGPATASTPSTDGDGPRGFRTPSRKIELYSEELAEHGYPPLPEFEEPRTSPISRPDLAARFPLVLTCAKSLWFCETPAPQRAEPAQPRPRPAGRAAPRHRAARAASPRVTGSGSRRRTAASAHAPGSTPASIRRSSAASTAGGRPAPSSACPAYPPFGPGSANLNLVLRQAAQRPDQRQLPAPRVGVRRGRADRGRDGASESGALRRPPARTVVCVPAGLNAAYAGGGRPPDTPAGRATAR